MSDTITSAELRHAMREKIKAQAAEIDRLKFSLMMIAEMAASPHSGKRDIWAVAVASHARSTRRQENDA